MQTFKTINSKTTHFFGFSFGSFLAPAFLPEFSTEVFLDLDFSPFESLAPLFFAVGVDLFGVFETLLFPSLLTDFLCESFVDGVFAGPGLSMNSGGFPMKMSENFSLFKPIALATSSCMNRIQKQLILYKITHMD